MTNYNREFVIGTISIVIKSLNINNYQYLFITLIIKVLRMFNFIYFVLAEDVVVAISLSGMLNIWMLKPTVESKVR